MSFVISVYQLCIEVLHWYSCMVWQAKHCTCSVLCYNLPIQSSILNVGGSYCVTKLLWLCVGEHACQMGLR